MDVAFIGRTAYVLVTLVSGDIVGRALGDASDAVGIYRLERDGSFTVVADLGAWSVDNPPPTAFFVTTGVQYSMQRFRVGSWSPTAITTGCCGSIATARSAPSSRLRTSCRPGSRGVGKRVLFTESGRFPTTRRTGRSSSLIPGPERPESWPAGRAWSSTSSGARGEDLCALPGPVGRRRGGFAGAPNRTAVTVQRDGSLRPVVDRSGAELVLDRPTSLEIVGDTAYVVSLAGNVVRIDNL